MPLDVDFAGISESNETCGGEFLDHCGHPDVHVVARDTAAFELG